MIKKNKTGKLLFQVRYFEYQMERMLTHLHHLKSPLPLMAVILAVVCCLEIQILPL